MTVLHDARRYHDIVRLLWRFGDSRLLKQAGLEQALVEEQMQAEAGGEAPGPEDEGDLAAALCALMLTSVALPATQVLPSAIHRTPSSRTRTRGCAFASGCVGRWTTSLRI